MISMQLVWVDLTLTLVGDNFDIVDYAGASPPAPRDVALRLSTLAARDPLSMLKTNPGHFQGRKNVLNNE